MRSTLAVLIISYLACVLAVPALNAGTQTANTGVEDVSGRKDNFDAAAPMNWPGLASGNQARFIRDLNDLTNAQRMQRGLPIAKPKLLKQKRLLSAPSAGVTTGATYLFTGCTVRTYSCIDSSCNSIAITSANGKTAATATAADIQSYVDKCAAGCGPKNSFLAGWYSGGSRFACLCQYQGSPATCSNEDYNYAQYVKQ